MSDDKELQFPGETALHEGEDFCLEAVKMPDGSIHGLIISGELSQTTIRRAVYSETYLAQWQEREQ